MTLVYCQREPVAGVNETGQISGTISGGDVLSVTNPTTGSMGC